MIVIFWYQLQLTLNDDRELPIKLCANQCRKTLDLNGSERDAP